MTTDNDAIEYLQEKKEEIASELTLNQFKDRLEWAKTNYEYGRINLALAEINKHFEYNNFYNLAIKSFKRALRVYKEQNDVNNKVIAIFAISKTLRCYAIRTGGDFGLSQLKYATKLLNEINKNLNNTDLHKHLVALYCEKGSLMRDYTQISHPKFHIYYLSKARYNFDQALKILSQKEDFFSWTQIMLVQASILLEIGNIKEKYFVKYIKKATVILESLIESNKISFYNLDSQYIDVVASFKLAFAYSDLAEKLPKEQSLSYLKKALLIFNRIDKSDDDSIHNINDIKLKHEKAKILYKLATLERDLDIKLTLLHSSVRIHRSILAVSENHKTNSFLHNINEYIANAYSDIAFLTTNKEEKCKFFKYAIEKYKKIISSVSSKLVLKKWIRYKLALAKNLSFLAQCSNNTKLIIKNLIESCANYVDVIKKMPGSTNTPIYKSIIKNYTILYNLSKDTDKKAAKNYMRYALLYLKQAIQNCSINSKNNLTLKHFNLLILKCQESDIKYILDRIEKFYNTPNLKKAWQNKTLLLKANLLKKSHKKKHLKESIAIYNQLNKTEEIAQLIEILKQQSIWYNIYMYINNLANIWKVKKV